MISRFAVSGIAATLVFLTDSVSAQVTNPTSVRVPPSFTSLRERARSNAVAIAAAGPAVPVTPPVVATPQTQVAPPPSVAVNDVTPPVPVPPSPPSPPPASQGPLANDILAWDGESKDYHGKVGAQAGAEMVFSFTNVTTYDVTINQVKTSCGCTTVQLPPMPWKIAPGASGQIPAQMTLVASPGTFTKTLTVYTDKGMKLLTLRAVLEPAPPASMSADERKRNQDMVKADPQAIFKGDCVRCHVQPVIGKVGKELYDSACGICHEAEHRASIVPSLHALNHDTNAEFWRTTIVNGKPGSLMPSFSQAKGGPLTDAQIGTLVDYLVKTMPAKAASTTGTDPKHATR